jgi:hypothetical protein
MAHRATAAWHHAVVKRRPEDIIGEWGVRDVTPRSLAERKELLDEAELNPLAGRPLKRRIRRFRPEADRYLASLGGPLPYMQRARQIENEMDEHHARLTESYAEHADDAEAWRRVAHRWDFGAVNDLIDRHNRYFPIEARLPMDPRTRDFVKVGGRSYRRELLDAEWIFERFPVPD